MSHIWALLRNSGLRRDLLFARWIQTVRTFSAVRGAEKRLMRAMRIWISAVWRSGSLAAMRSSKALKPRIQSPGPGGRAVLFPRSPVLADRDDRGCLAVEDGGR